MTFLVIRVRSDRGVKPKIRATMSMLNLTRVNHAVLIPDTPAYAGMLQKAKDYITCLLYTSPSPRDVEESRMPSSA